MKDNNARIVKKNYFLRNQLIRPRVRREIKLVKIKFGDAKVAKRKLHKFNIDVMRRRKFGEKFCTFDNQRFIIIFILKQINPSFSWFTFSRTFQRIFNEYSINCGESLCTIRARYSDLFLFEENI